MILIYMTLYISFSAIFCFCSSSYHNFSYHEISSVINSKRPKDAFRKKFPENCPICETLLYKIKKEAVIRCPNFACPAVVCERIKHFASNTATPP